MLGMLQFGQIWPLAKVQISCYVICRREIYILKKMLLLYLCLTKIYINGNEMKDKHFWDPLKRFLDKYVLHVRSWID